MKYAQKIRQELTEKHGLRLGVWAVVAILLLYSLILLRDYDASLLANIENLTRRQGRLESILQERFWPEQLVRLTSLAAEQEHLFLRADSMAIAKAESQNFLKGLLRKHGVEKSRLTIIGSKKEGPAIMAISVRLEGNFQPTSFYSLLQELENTSANVTQLLEVDGRRRRFTLESTLYYMTQAKN